jgi:SHS2 domain-containing protein
MKQAGFRFLDHTADVQVECWGSSLEEAFSQCALSLMTVITPDLSKITPSFEKDIWVSAEDKESLLFDFLSEFLYIFDVEELVFSDIWVVYINRTQLGYEMKAIMKGEKFNKEKHEIGTEVKAITYSFMEINETLEGTNLKVVFDI